jgi:hypothetical protein
MTLFEADVLFAVEAGPKILANATRVVADEMASMIFPKQQQFPSSEATSEAELFTLPVKPLKDSTIEKKKRLGLSSPEVPRLRYGLMIQELKQSGDTPMTTSALVGIASTRKHRYQQQERPFIGITPEAIRKIEAGLPAWVEKELSFFDGKTIDTGTSIEVTV